MAKSTAKDGDSDGKMKQRTLLGFFGKPKPAASADSPSTSPILPLDGKARSIASSSKPASSSPAPQADSSQSLANESNGTSSTRKRVSKSPSLARAKKSKLDSSTPPTSDPEPASVNVSSEPTVLSSSPVPAQRSSASLIPRKTGKRASAVSYAESEDDDDEPKSSKATTRKKSKVVLDSDDESDYKIDQDDKASPDLLSVASSEDLRSDASLSPAPRPSTKKRPAKSSSKSKARAKPAESERSASELELSEDDDKPQKLAPLAKQREAARKAIRAVQIGSAIRDEGEVGTGPQSLGGGAHKSRAELEKIKQKAKEDAFEFLVDPRDANKNRPGHADYDPSTLYVPTKAMENLTQFEQQFWEIKKNHFDTVLFFQKGKFYELYENDARIGHSEFGLKLTDRVKMCMVGVPEATFDFWAAKFLAQGYKVGRVDQAETAIGMEMRHKDAKSAGEKASSKKIVQRELNCVLTSGTIVDERMLSDDLSQHCIAIREYTPSSSARPQFGLCVLDASTAEFRIIAFADDICRTKLETTLRLLRPRELVHERVNLSQATTRILRNVLPLQCTWNALKAADFADGKGDIHRIFAAVNRAVPAPITQIYDNEQAMSALGGLIAYLRSLNLDKDLVTTGNFQLFDPVRSGERMVLDGQTLAHLEVLQNSQGGSEGTLISLLSRCVTPFGTRMLKGWVCQPLRAASAINARLEIVACLIEHADFANTFEKATKTMPDLERLISRIHAGTIKTKDFDRVVTCFEQIDRLLGRLGSIAKTLPAAGLAQTIASAPDLVPLVEKLRGLFQVEEHELVPLSGADTLYDDCVDAVVAIEKDLYDCLSQYRRNLKSNDLTFKDIGTKEIYQVQVPVKIKVPSNWTQMSKTKDWHRYYSPEVEKLVRQLKEARERRNAAIKQFKGRLCAAFDQHYDIWLQAVKLIAEIDCLLSLAKSSAALGEPSCRPVIVDSDRASVDFENLRHPCIFASTPDFIPNDVQLGASAKSTMLVTGANASGKSTLLRSVAIATIMAQIGCFVPASAAKLSPVDTILTRMGAQDQIYANASTFKVEMDDTKKILSDASMSSLVILDELGRGTESGDGYAIAFATLHALATRNNCIGFFATHFTSLVSDFAYHTQIRPCCMATEMNDNTREVTFLYRLVDGATTKSYGPNVAKMAGIPSDLVERAIAISSQFEVQTKQREASKRKSEDLPLTLQTDTSYLVKQSRAVAQSTAFTKTNGQLARTLFTIRENIQVMSL
ncbi:uncharacterized protein L969DRAFT_93899 [Mixia osmundae IAM 14324]|uniref:DNA mismatch repair protein n=1 Tax=Mixia osmundae (strain CBS 9802 / IAM 14324 / JCM 22182 / KY 12970) TaxID=764103 RepID=G7E9W9_MIXOS|nr:uncharacterized protein L969DRAFT_93899 [Mixia osmundae IAM 14324]KEI40072.1 hypothetical protein L969DRAFT_93899 [Mixia osmundae IAM 14324]GAA99438.1 hypothetical protein E5Q_06137 [Mixia osmundae IAM 14324]